MNAVRAIAAGLASLAQALAPPVRQALEHDLALRWRPSKTLSSTERRREMASKRWQNPVNILLGLWLFASPWVLHFVHQMERDSWNFFLTGAAVALFAVAALSMHAVWEEWVTLALGLWMIASPWILGFSAHVAALRDAVAAGILVVVFSVWAMVRDRRDSAAAAAR